MTDAAAPVTPATKPPFWHVRARLLVVTGGAAVYPLVVLFGLNAVDELDRTAFGVLLPDIRDHFGLDTSGILTLVALASLGGLLLEIPLAFYADRLHRARIAVGGAAVWGVFSVFTGLAPTIGWLVFARSGAAMGRAVVNPTHNSLLSDYYAIDRRASVFGFHRAANAVGQFLGPLLGGLLAYWYGWRAPFFLFAIPTAIFVVLGLRLRDPVRGAHERAAAGASGDAITTEEIPPSFAEATRILWQVRTLRRIWYSLPFLAGSLIGLGTLTSLFYDEAFGLDEAQRGMVAAIAEPAALVGLSIGIPLAGKLMLRDAGLGLRLVSIVIGVIAIAFAIFSLTTTLWLAVAMNVIITGSGALLFPCVYAALSLAIAPKVRSLGFAMASVWILPGLLMLPIVGAAADAWGIRQGMLLMVPVFIVGGIMLSSAGVFVTADIKKVWTSTAAQSEVLYARRQGEVKLLLVRNLDVSYDSVQVLFGVDFEIDEGEIVALLGTNGAGKSTLLKAIAGLVDADAGAIVFDGRDATYAPPHEVAARGIVMVPGGQGVFPSLTVEENLRLAGWLDRRDRAKASAAVEAALERFPVLRERMHEPAANLSGGQQQMLTLAMAFLSQPRLLMIDELSLGLAPSIVAELLDAVRDLRDRGTTIILVEQSVNVALTVAETAYFMEKGEIRFHGPTAELLERPDVLRSVFLEGAASATGGAGSTPPTRNGHVPPGARTVEAALASFASPNGERAEPRLSVRNVSKRFGGINALTDVSFDVGAGEIVGFLGPNGAGKTTLFDVLSGFLPADSGEVELDGRDVTELGASGRARRGLGRSFQDGRLFPALTVSEALAVALRQRGLSGRGRIGRRVDELIELTGISAFRDKYVRELSTGSRRIVDLTGVLAHEPRVLLLDEPSSGIAQREAEALGPLLLRIRAMTGTSLLVIEHDVPLLTSIADWMIALDLGEVVAMGAPTDVVRHPRVVASYLGESKAVIARSGFRGGE